MQKIFRFSLVFIISLIMLVFSSTKGIVLASDSMTGESKATIAGLVLGGGSILEEYVTLYNGTDTEINLDGWRLEYAKNSFTSSDCSLAMWSTSTSGGGFSQSLNGLSLPAGGILAVEQQLNNSGDGSIRLVETIDSSSVVQDLVGWGSAPPCYEIMPSSIPAATKAVQRYLDCENIPIDSGNNFADFTSISLPSPTTLQELHLQDCSDSGGGDNNDPDDGQGGGSGGSDSATQSNCTGAIINELLPNPAGNDTNNEFIELYNPTPDTIELGGCKLQTSANSKVYTFAIGDSLAPGGYKAFYNSSTGLTLSNSSAGSVYLIDTADVELGQVDYPADLDDDVSWSLMGSEWQKTFLPTPNAQNRPQDTMPCPDGEVRNPDTNRCINILSAAAGLAPCAPGKQRNPETNRCRSISSIESVLKACAADQVRNPLTNRCKKASGSSVTPCKPDQERNPETNRCRKISASSFRKLDDVKDVLSTATPQDNSAMVFAGFSVLGATAYGLWEWRSELYQLMAGIKAKFSS